MVNVAKIRRNTLVCVCVCV